jgi:hypothetical protein
MSRVPSALGDRGDERAAGAVSLDSRAIHRQDVKNGRVVTVVERSSTFESIT